MPWMGFFRCLRWFAGIVGYCYAVEADCRSPGISEPVLKRSGAVFAVLWAGPESNGKKRAAMWMRFWKGDGGVVSELATRLAGSSDLYSHSGRRPYASINFVCSHDGFTLNDLVSYNEKHNEADLEDRCRMATTII